MPTNGSAFLPSLIQAFVNLEASHDLSTDDFVEACAKVLPFFDHIGTVFMIAKHEFAGKRETLIAVAPSCPTLKSIVEKAKIDGNITIKNSPGRNLHRLINSIAFITEIFKGLLVGKTLKDAVSTAYDATLSQLHNWVVRTGIKAGMIGLPSREHFLESIGETEESAREHGQAFVIAAENLVGHISSLYHGVDMPRSDFTMNSLWGGK